MLSAAAFADFDAPRLAGLRVQVQSMAVRQDRYRREALSLGVSPDNPETYRLIQCAEHDAAALADLERLLALALRFAADESTRPTAPVLRLVPKTGPDAAPSRRPARALLARALAAIAGASAGTADPHDQAHPTPLVSPLQGRAPDTLSVPSGLRPGAGGGL